MHGTFFLVQFYIERNTAEQRRVGYILVVHEAIEGWDVLKAWRTWLYLETEAIFGEIFIGTGIYCCR